MVKLYKGDAGISSLSISETMVVQTSVDGESLFQKVKTLLVLQYQCSRC